MVIVVGSYFVVVAQPLRWEQKLQVLGSPAEFPGTAEMREVT